MTLRQRIRFYQQLAVLVRAGLPIRGSLARLQERMSSPEITILTQKVNAGERIGEAFAAARFSPFECHLVTAGEQSAQLETIFEHLAEFWSRQREMRQDLLSQLYYPVTMLHLALAVAALSELAVGSWTDVQVKLIEYFCGLYVIGVAVFFLVRFSWRSEMAQHFWLRVPIIGSTLSTAYAYRWITAVKLEFSAGISLSRAVPDAWRASGYVERERLAEEAEQALREGAQLSALMRGWKRLPRDWIDFIETGEVSGALETAFKNLEKEAARAYAQAQQRMTQWMPKIASFIILLIVGALVIHIVYRAYIFPIINVENQIENVR